MPLKDRSQEPPALARRVAQVTSDLKEYTYQGNGVDLFPYQIAPVDSLMHSIKHKLGMTIVIIFPRQSGKDEFLVCLKAWLLDLMQGYEVGIVEVNPTYKPQTLTAIFRFEKRLQANILTRGRWGKRGDFMRTIGAARCAFLSGDRKANVVGATANLLLIVNEAQDIQPDIYAQRFEPMCASTNATRLICGTVWTSNTLLALEARHAKEAQRDGIQRLFMYDADHVRVFNTAYGSHVDNAVRKRGRNHPMIKTQYFNEEIDAQASLFNPGRRALMIGDQPAQEEPIQGHIYAMTIDVAGQDEAVIDGLEALENPGRDSMTLDIIDVSLESLEDLQKPTYRVVFRKSWVGQSHPKIYGQIVSLVQGWNIQHLVIDATGVGEGLWGWMEQKFPGKVIPVKYSASVKSLIGWRFLDIIETGRFRDCCPSEEISEQYTTCQHEILPGPGKVMRWGVPDGTRSPASGNLIHDDWIMADSLVTELDQLEWFISSPSSVSKGQDFLGEMDGNY